MDIVWYGGDQLSVNNKKDTITFNCSSKSGSIEVYSHQREDDEAKPEVLHWPGEYEINEILFTGIPVTRKAGDQMNIFTMNTRGVAFCHLGNLDRKLNDEEVERIGNINVLFLPVGGNDSCLTSKMAREVMEQIEPNLVVPMMFKYDGCKDDLCPVTDFLKEVGVAASDHEKKASVEKSKLNLETTEFALLEVQKLS